MILSLVKNLDYSVVNRVLDFIGDLIREHLEVMKELLDPIHHHLQAYQYPCYACGLVYNWVIYCQTVWSALQLG